MASSGTITQTFSIITQSADAYQQLDAQLVDVITASAHPGEAAEEELVAGVSATDGISLETTEALAGTVTTSDEFTYEVDILIESTLTGTDSFLGSEWTTIFNPSSFSAEGKLSHGTDLLVSSTIQAFDSIESTRDTEISSSAIASNTIDPGIIYNQLEVSTVYAQNVIGTGQGEFIVENIIARDTLLDTLVANELLTSLATALDTQESWSVQSAELEAMALVSESFDFAGSIYSEMLSNTAIVIDTIWAKDFGAIAWTMNTKSGALTNYNNYGFTSLAFHNGKLYATSPEGLFEMGADNDDGRDIDAHTLSGFDDYGTDRKKRVSDIFVGYTGGELECDVETYDGPEEVYTYGMKYREADAPRNNRLKVGRGLSSTYWRLGFRNVGGADFQIYNVAVQIATSIRRL